ncbi:MAG TPA: DUF128 domain-containing protein [Methanosarcinaceae archaeon]|nr:DUF128 domain-containing protein [Methanosarcinaceae archaeon]
MTAPQIERKLIEIMRVVSESDKPIGARIIADELNDRGYGIGERAVRYHLRILDKRGFTIKHGYAGRTVTKLGKRELKEALIGDRLGFVITRIEDLIYRTDYDLRSKSGNVIVNISNIDKNDFDDVMDIMRYASQGGAIISPRIRIIDERDNSDIYVPEGKIAIATVCSITFDGLLLKNGIPVEPSYGGILELDNHEPVRFIDVISYSGTSIDPIKIFMNRHSTSVLDVLETGTGKMLANMRQIPAAAAGKARDVLELAKMSDLSGAITVGMSGESLFGAPASAGKSGIPVFVGVNAIAAVEETGIEVNTYPVSTVMEYSKMSEI